MQEEGFCGGHDLNRNFWRANGRKRNDAKCIRTIEILMLLNFRLWISIYYVSIRKALDLTGYSLYSARLRVNKTLFELTKEN